MLTAANVQELLAKPFMPAVFFFAGVSYDAVTLSRIDHLLDNLILLVYITLLGLLIVVTGRDGLKRPEELEVSETSPTVPRLLAKGRPFFPNAIQFLLGGLFSAYAIFYIQSASFATTAVFFMILVGFLVANEFLRNRLSSLKLLVTLYALVCFSFFTYFIPVLVRFMNTFVFLLGAAFSLAVVLWVVEMIYSGFPERSKREKVLAGAPAVAVVLFLIGFYFLNWIPPVPLSLKFGGIYSEVAREGEHFSLQYEKGSWYQFWKDSDDPFRGEGPAYCFTAVFAPVDLKTTIYHRWQFRMPGRNGEEKFVTSDRIGVKISGGREGGYRTFTYKQRLAPGDWRVNVETESGRLIGRVNFSVEQREPGVNGHPVEFETLIY